MTMKIDATMTEVSDEMVEAGYSAYCSKIGLFRTSQRDSSGKEAFRAALTAALAAANARVERLERAMEAVARYAWRTDPPNANNPFTDDMRFSAIKYHPTVQEFGKPHVELAGSEARAALTGAKSG